LLQKDGVRTNQVTQVRGYADQMLRVKNNPTDPSNRRISILVKNDNEAVPTLSAAKIVDGSTPLPGAQKPTAALAEKGKPQAAQPMNVAGTKPAIQAPAEVQAQAPPKPAAQTATKSSAATPAAKPSLLDRLKSLWPGKKK
jgi:chemotaxis protein MotB